MWEEFSPFPSRNHMIYNLSAKGFVFLDGVGFIENAVVLVGMQTNTSEKMVSIQTTPCIPSVSHIQASIVESRKVKIYSSTNSFNHPFRTRIVYGRVITIFVLIGCCAITAIFCERGIKTEVTVF